MVFAAPSGETMTPTSVQVSGQVRLWITILCLSDGVIGPVQHQSCVAATSGDL